MKFSKFILSIFILCSALLNSCDEVFDKDIEGDKVQLYSPSNNATITSNNALFKWNALDGAVKYRLQVVSPSFSSVSNVLADTIITGTQFSLVLRKGSYQWTVTAINNTAQAYSDTLSLTIIQTNDLTNSIVANTYPKGVIASTANNFSWDAVFGAKSYSVSIWKNQFQSGTLIDVATVTTNSFTTTKTLADGTYVWAVKATNDSTETQYTKTSITIDTSIPNAPTLISPADKYTLLTSENSINLNWTSGTDIVAGTNRTDSLYISKNIDFSYATTKIVTGGSSVETITEAGTYYWSVKTVDAAGNVSPRSTSRSFIKN